LHFAAGLVAVLGCLFAPIASAQSVSNPGTETPIIYDGNAAVTGFSGVVALKPVPNSNPEDYLVIDAQAPALQVFDLSEMYCRTMPGKYRFRVSSPYRRPK
jgi:hypothetical protein